MRTLRSNSLFSFGLAFFISATALSFSNSVMADEEFYGRIESRPMENPGIWVISGQQVEVTDNSKIDNDNGPLVVGSCVEVEHTKGVVKEIESSKPNKCE
jgi:hypothetical protein